jgi:adenylosuccinate lyase
MVQRHAMRAWREGLNFHQLVLTDKEITTRVPAQQIERAFDLRRQLKNVDKIFARVFNNAGKGKNSGRRPPRPAKPKR